MKYNKRNALICCLAMLFALIAGLDVCNQFTSVVAVEFNGPNENDIPSIRPVVETPGELLYDNQSDVTKGPDSDDSAVWIHKANRTKSVIVTAMKHGGLRVYDLKGKELQRFEIEGTRYNNIDMLYGVGADKVDLAVVSDRANDTVAFYQVKSDATLVNVTGKVPETIFGVDDGEATAYGLATYSASNGRNYAFVTQADGAAIAQIEIKQHAGRFVFEIVRTLKLPVAKGDKAKNYQAEGVAIDHETGIGYVAVEERLGLLKFDAKADGSRKFEVVASLESSFFEPDLEGVTIHYGKDGAGLILVSSQGNNTYSAFDRVSHRHLGSFSIRSENGIDGVEETDGVEIVSTGFKNGMLITQDGSNEPKFILPDPEDGKLENCSTNFKFSDLGDMLNLFGIEPNSDFDPRAR